MNEVRYIKLGSHGDWFDPCEASGSLRLGFWTGVPEMFTACREHRWDEVRRILRAKRGKDDGASVEDDLRQIREVFEDRGDTTWITFHRRNMYWANLDPGREPSFIEGANGGWSEHPLRGTWSCRTTDPDHAELRLDDLAGHLGQVTQYRGTICEPARPGYVLNRIRGVESELAGRADSHVRELEGDIVEMMRELTPYDFEILVDLTFAQSGWRRVGRLGGTEADVDLVLARSTTASDPDGSGEERMAVQVKSTTNQKEFTRYADKLSTYPMALYVFHTPTRADLDSTGHPTIRLLGADGLASMVLDAGMTRWLMRRVR